MSTLNDTPNDDIDVSDLSLDSLGELLDEEDLPQDLNAEPEEEPTEISQDPEQDEDEPDGDPDDLDLDDDPDGDEVEDEEDTDPDELEDKARAGMQKRIDELTYKSKSAEERNAELEQEIETLRAKAESAVPPSLDAGFSNEQEIDARDRDIRSAVRMFEGLVAGQPDTLTDEVSGKRVDNMVEFNGEEYPVKHVRSRIWALRDEREELPRAREQVKQRQEANAAARKQMPSAWKPGTPAYRERQALLKDRPALAGMGDQVVVEALLGRMLLQKQKQSRAAAVSKSKVNVQPKSGARVPKKPGSKKTNYANRTKQILDHMTVEDRELAALAAELD